MATRRTRRVNRGGVRIVLWAIAVTVALLYMSHSHARRDLRAHVVAIDSGSGVRITPVLAAGNPSGTETFSRMVTRLKPYAAINGTFYDENMRPLGDILIGGKLVNRGHYRHAIAATKAGKVKLIRRNGRKFDWSGFTSGLAAGPLLVRDGKVALDPVADGFSRSSLTIIAYRSGVGITKAGKLLLVTTKEPMTLSEFAQLMLDLGAAEAMNLDGGGARALYHRGKMLATPSLPMTNLLVVYKDDRR